MRLTLRTLLAYMDGLLDPKDSQEIGKKIEASKFATDLFHKIRDVMRRLRLAAPSLTERGTNLDCNTVAEYLDNALPKDRVPDFEEVSLKSELHLAEVASCHQILTMVLGEPAEIDPESRQRMYQLPTVANRVDEERQAAVEAANMLSGDGSGSASPAPPMKVRPRPVVPEYLREPREEVAAPARRGLHVSWRRRGLPAADRAATNSTGARRWATPCTGCKRKCTASRPTTKTATTATTRRPPGPREILLPDPAGPSDPTVRRPPSPAIRPLPFTPAATPARVMSQSRAQKKRERNRLREYNLRSRRPPAGNRPNQRPRPARPRSLLRRPIRPARLPRSIRHSRGKPA